MTQTISTKLSDEMVEKVDKLVKSGLYLSRSEAIREAARALWLKQKGSLKGIGKKEQVTTEDRERVLKELIKEKGWDKIYDL